MEVYLASKSPPLAQNPMEVCHASKSPPLAQNPNGSMPCIWNDREATIEQKTALLTGLRNSQGPGLVHLQNALRTPAGRPVRP